MNSNNIEKHLKIISNWLFFCCFSVFCMIIVGAITRLSGSGLSIVEWEPLMGAIPPLNEEEWQRVFEMYKSSPEYQKKNFWMEISDFKSIFFWEWFHRLLGRLIGVFYALPFIFFLIKGWVPKGFKIKLFAAFLMGGAQGFMGWYMVKSGLVDMPAVSHYRLAAHLSLALLIYGYMLWLGLRLRNFGSEITDKDNRKLQIHGLVTLAAIIVTILWGAFTAGLDAGLIYNETFPKMGATWFPEELWFHKPLWLNFFENHASVQFTHRWVAIITLLITLSFCAHGIMKQRNGLYFSILAAVIFIQVGLGIATLLSGVSLPLAVMHQGGAVILLTLIISVIYKIRYST